MEVEAAILESRFIHLLCDFDSNCTPKDVPGRKLHNWSIVGIYHHLSKNFPQFLQRRQLRQREESPQANHISGARE